MTWPRQHAINILSIDDREGRNDYLNKQVPAEFRDWVKKYVGMWWRRRKEILREKHEYELSSAIAKNSKTRKRRR